MVQQIHVLGFKHQEKHSTSTAGSSNYSRCVLNDALDDVVDDHNYNKCRRIPPPKSIFLDFKFAYSYFCPGH